MKDDKGNPLSLVRYCDAFGVKEAGPAHDPAVDAENLALLYDATMRNNHLLLEEYKKVLKNFSHFPLPEKYKFCVFFGKTFLFYY